MILWLCYNTFVLSFRNSEANVSNILDDFGQFYDKTVVVMYKKNNDSKILPWQLTYTSCMFIRLYLICYNQLMKNWFLIKYEL